MKFIFIFLTIIVVTFTTSSARFACLQQNGSKTCHCDEGEKIIDCNSLGLTEFPRINETLKGYVGLTLAHNSIRPSSIPWEGELLRKLPDLAVIDFRGVRNLNCDQLQLKFERIHIMSSCEYNEETSTRRNGAPNGGKSTSGENNNCETFWCRVRTRIEKTWLKVYAHVDYLWQNMKKKACNLVCKNRNENSLENFSAQVRGRN